MFLPIPFRSYHFSAFLEKFPKSLVEYSTNGRKWVKHITTKNNNVQFACVVFPTICADGAPSICLHSFKHSLESKMCMLCTRVNIGRAEQSITKTCGDIDAKPFVRQENLYSQRLSLSSSFYLSLSYDRRETPTPKASFVDVLGSVRALMSM